MNWVGFASRAFLHFCSVMKSCKGWGVSKAIIEHTILVLVVAYLQPSAIDIAVPELVFPQVRVDVSRRRKGVQGEPGSMGRYLEHWGHALVVLGGGGGV